MTPTPRESDKPSNVEDEYFFKLDQELLRQQRARLDAERQAAERKSHYMKCPKCGHDLVEVPFQHVKVDRCPDCGGMWFDRGEFEMLQHLQEDGVGRFVRELMNWAGRK